MHYILARVLFNSCFAQLLKTAQVRDGNTLPAAFVNYVVAAVLAGLAMLVTHAPVPHSTSLLLAVCTGFTYAISLLGIESGMRLMGVGITVALLQLSVMVPTAASILFFKEQPTAWQTAGIATAIAALPLLSRSRASGRTEPAPLPAVLLAVFLLFFVTGISGVTMKLQSDIGPGADRYAFSAVLFGVSAVVVGIAVRLKRAPWGPSALPLGSLIGLSNVLQLEFTLLALAAMPAVIVFPISSALTVTINALLSVWLWRERMDLAGGAGIALAMLAAVLLNM
jgi:drug/metabolite transporter (DMT)-like permease